MTTDAAEAMTLTETAYRRLRHDIIAGIRRPGERLRLERLRGIYDIGPTPMREALQKLSVDGLVLSEGNRGFTVAPLDPREFEDLNVARTAIEKEALRLSISRGGADWEARVVAAAYLMAKWDAKLGKGAGAVPDAWERANAEFHLALVSACGSNWLLIDTPDTRPMTPGVVSASALIRRAMSYSRKASLSGWKNGMISSSPTLFVPASPM